MHKGFHPKNLWADRLGGLLRNFVGMGALIFPSANLLAQSPTKTASPLQESRVIPLESGFRSWERSTFGFGLYAERPQYRFHKRYKAGEPALSFSYDQHIRSMWSGGLQIRLSHLVPHSGVQDDDLIDAETCERLKREGKIGGSSPSTAKQTPVNCAEYKDDGSMPKLAIAPVSIFSRIEAAPRLNFLPGDFFPRFFRPFATAGLGYVYFLQARSLPIEKARGESGESALTAGGGIRFVVPRVVAVRLSAERWRGLNSFKYSSLTYQLELQAGDVDGR